MVRRQAGQPAVQVHDLRPVAGRKDAESNAVIALQVIFRQIQTDGTAAIGRIIGVVGRALGPRRRFRREDEFQPPLHGGFLQHGTLPFLRLERVRAVGDQRQAPARLRACPFFFGQATAGNGHQKHHQPTKCFLFHSLESCYSSTFSPPSSGWRSARGSGMPRYPPVSGCGRTGNRHCGPSWPYSSIRPGDHPS